MFERISLAAVMIYVDTFKKNQGCLYSLFIAVQGAGPCLKELLSLLPKHPHPKIWGQSHSMQDIPQGNTPHGESCRLCQVSRHKNTPGVHHCPGAI